MSDFKIGDFIRLKNVSAYQIDRISDREINIFEIANISPTHVEIHFFNNNICWFMFSSIFNSLQL